MELMNIPTEYSLGKFCFVFVPLQILVKLIVPQQKVRKKTLRIKCSRS